MKDIYIETNQTKRFRILTQKYIWNAKRDLGQVKKIEVKNG